ncbi:hypothetical protein Tco_0763255, partial [Tanacetum coccineum]
MKALKEDQSNFEERKFQETETEEDNDAEKEELRDSMDVVPRDDVAIDVESLATKYPIVDWKTYILNKIMMYYQIIRADGSSKNYKIFSEMLDDFDRQDVIDLHRLCLALKLLLLVLEVNIAGVQDLFIGVNIDTSYGDEIMEELTDVLILMARIQPADGNAETVPSYDAKAIS